MRIHYKSYPGCVLATILSFIGGIFCLLAVLALLMGILDGSFLDGVLLAALFFGAGILMQFLARQLAEARHHARLRKTLKENGTQAQIVASQAAAEAVYNAYPNRRTLNYIQSLNPAAAASIRAKIQK